MTDSTGPCACDIWGSEIEDIKCCLAEIDQATEIIQKNRVRGSTPHLGSELTDLTTQIQTILNRILNAGCRSKRCRPPPSSTIEVNGYVVEAEAHEPNSKRARYHPKLNHHEVCPHPGCGAGPLDKKPLRRHFATHIYCSDISQEDAQCICCKEPLKTVSTFKKNHVRCLDRLKNELSRETIAKAVKQRARIIETANRMLDDALQAIQNGASVQYLYEPRQNSEHEQPSATSPMPAMTSSVGDTSAMQISQPNIDNIPTANFESLQHQEAYTTSSLHGVVTESCPASQPCNYSSALPSTTPDLEAARHGVRAGTVRYEGLLYNRSATMVVNPMDGLFWGVPEQYENILQQAVES